MTEEREGGGEGGKGREGRGVDSMVVLYNVVVYYFSSLIIWMKSCFFLI